MSKLNNVVPLKTLSSIRNTQNGPKPVFNKVVSLSEALASGNLAYVEAIMKAHMQGYNVRLV